MSRKQGAVAVHRMDKTNGPKPRILSLTLATDGGDEGGDEKERENNPDSPDSTSEQSRRGFARTVGHVPYPSFVHLGQSDPGRARNKTRKSIQHYNKPNEK